MSKQAAIPDGAKHVTAREIREIVTCDFTELTEIRQTVRELVKRYRKKLQGTHRGNYDYSGFYVGRGVTRLSFFNLYVSQFQMRRIVSELVLQYKHNIMAEGNNLHIYLRGVRR